MGHTVPFPGLRPMSSMSCQAQISHSATHSVSQSLAWSLKQEPSAGHGSPLPLTLGKRSVQQVGCKVQFGYCLWLCSETLAGCTVPLHHSLWACAAEMSLRTCQPLLESSLQSSCPPFLTNAWLFTLPTFQAVWRLSKSRSNTAQLLPSPGVTKHPSFSGASVHSPSGCVPSLCVFHFHSTSPSDFQHPGPS